jgi:fermentation-respiration switch protein FrsA (DUF1100 family)
MMLRTDDNPDGLPIEVFDEIRAGEARNRAQLYRDLADGPFFGHNRRQDVDQGFRDAFWLMSMACGHRAAYECIAAWSATDFRPDLEKIDVPTLVIHGDDDQVVPIEVGGKRSAEMVRGARLKVYEGGSHALPFTESGSTPTCWSSSTPDGDGPSVQVTLTITGSRWSGWPGSLQRPAPPSRGRGPIRPPPGKDQPGKGQLPARTLARYWNHVRPRRSIDSVGPVTSRVAQSAISPAASWNRRLARRTAEARSWLAKGRTAMAA